MSSAGISFGGLGSGLDTKAIISALVAVERRPIAALENKKTSLNRQKSLFSDFGKLLADLQKSAKSLSTTRGFLQMRGSSSNEDLLTVSAGSGASPGTHEIIVDRLATAQVNASLGSADRSTTHFGAGTLFVTVGGTAHPIEISADGNGNTLDGIAATINEQAATQDFDIAAEVVDTGRTGNQRYQLVVRGTELGTAGAFSLSVEGDTTLTNLFTEVSGNRVVEGRNAELRLDGVAVQRSTNSIADLISGVTIDLRAANTTERVAVTVVTNADETSKKVQDFVDAYNKVVDFLSTQNSSGDDGQTRGPLFGDATLRSVRSNLRRMVGESMNTGNAGIAMLANIGISSDREGHLTFDRSRFADQLGTDEQAVAFLFTDATRGIAGRVADQIDIYTDSVDGLIKARTDGLDRLVRDTQKRIDGSEERLGRFQQTLEARFANLETLLAKLQGQGSALSSFPTTGR